MTTSCATKVAQASAEQRAESSRMGDDQNEELVGTVERCVFQHPDNGFSVFSVTLASGHSVTVTGSLAHVQPGHNVCFQGRWGLHPKFGKQFEASSCSAHTPTTITGLKKYLGSGFIKGIGPVYAERLVNRFGTDVLKVIEHEPQRLAAVPGIGSKRVEKIVAGWVAQKEISSIMIFLQERGVSTTFATKIYKAYGARAREVLGENPYRLIDDIWGVGFKTADKLARQLGIEERSYDRVRAGVMHVLSTTVKEGHLYGNLEKVKETTRTVLELDETIDEIMAQALRDLHAHGKIKLITTDDGHFIALSQHYFCEKGVANKIRRMLERGPDARLDAQSVYAALRVPRAGDIVLNEDQQRGIMACAQHPVAVITGGPGTGKTTLIKKLITILEESSMTYKLTAPTGRAAKRLQEGTGRSAATLHRLLGFDFTTMHFVHNDQNALKADVFIIDEASMLDIFLAHALLKAVPMGSHIVFIGDIDQLPSVGAGNFLNDVIASDVVPTVRLTEIFRQARGSLIIVNAHRVNKGQFPVTYADGSARDFVYIREDDPTCVPQRLATIFAGLGRYGIQEADTVVLVPMNRGPVGTYVLNTYLQGLLNPGRNEKTVTSVGTTYKIGDRVMQIRNNYDKLVFNGDTGFIDAIDGDEKTMAVNFGDRKVVYEFTEIDELVLAYALSIHKSQGSEYAATIIPLFTCHFALLQRNLLYTAITRSKKLCVLIGQPKAIALALKNNKSVERTTFLREFLTTDIQCR